MLFSALLAGPIGVATDAGELAAEKLTGLDPEKIGDKILAKLGIHGTQPSGMKSAKAGDKPGIQPTPPATETVYGRIRSLPPMG